MQSANNHYYDALLALQAPGSAAITSTTPSSQINIYEILTSPYGALNGMHGLGVFDLCIYVQALDHTTGDETYTIQVQTVNGEGATTVQETFVLTTANVGEMLTFPLDPKTFEGYDPDAQLLQLNCVLGGTTPSLTYYAYLSSRTNA